MLKKEVRKATPKELEEAKKLLEKKDKVSEK